jgi:Fur family ferric uptake transcriptional regulator
MTEGLESLPCGRPLPKKEKNPPELKRLLEGALLRLENFVLKQNLNRSEARAKILEVIVKESRHFSTQDLLDRLQERYPEVGRATVYRNLPILVQSGLIVEGPTDADGQIHYELADDEHHDHIMCLDCKRIFEFHDDSIEARQASISKKMGFTVKEHRHVVYASCDFRQGK